jgi:hypothetical protein|tara:strand:- start:1260 stop:1490 length:231 start_codon:yes stop_codon:yes gene_type:complete
MISKDTIELVSWKQVVKRYGYKESKNKGTRFGLKLELEGMYETQFIWCESSLERKKLFKTIIRIAKKEGRDLTVIQ